MTHRSVIRITSVLLAALVMGCEKDDPTSIAPEQRFTVSPIFTGIDLGGTEQLTAQVGTSPVPVTWESSNPAVATVSATGLVTSLAVGFTAVTATQVADPSQKLSANINVLPVFPSILLQNNVPIVVSSNGAFLSLTMYRITVPAGKTKLTVTTTGPNNLDLDLLVRKGALPTTNNTTFAVTADCYSGGASTNETCVINNPAKGTYYIGLWLFDPYSGVTLTAKYE
ncbi:MAG TPA: pre-peptidase C-terminal domain-containing protein [Gemmatimonadaceae bacterium]|nr:pre-peptidase C-terminal domain-containing protein [Gemmatimonadaceae bacterium]